MFPALMAIVLVGCSTSEQTRAPAAPDLGGQTEVVGTLVTVEDDRPVDGGVDLTLDVGQGALELVRVASAFIAGPRDTVLAMHAVVDQAKIGDRLRARGTRDETGALRPVFLELIEPARSSFVGTDI
jgi:hypothetical protein